MSLIAPITKVLANFQKCHLNRVLFANISVSSYYLLDKKWREEKGLPLNPNKERMLLDLPDYSFLDKRPIPYGSRQKQRIEKQMQYTEKIIQLTSEIDFAVTRHQEKLKEKKKEVKAIIDKKLRPKGDKLLQGKQ